MFAHETQFGASQLASLLLGIYPGYKRNAPQGAQFSSAMKHPIRPATDADLQTLTDLWHQGWIQAHAAHVPAELTALRTRDSFAARLADMLPNTSMLGPEGKPLGFCATRNNEIYQMYVSSAAQGTGAAAALIKDGEASIRTAGHTEAFLEVIPQNPRAIGFYEKMGWQRKGVETVMLDTLGAPFPLDCLIMTKDL